MNWSKQTGNPVFWIGILLVTVLAYVYFMNEGYTDGSGNKAIDASGSTVTLSLSDLIKALTFANKTGTPDDVLKPPVFTPSTNILPVQVGGETKATLDSEVEKRLSKNIATQIKDELLAQRATTPMENGCSGSGNQCSEPDSCSSESCAQGNDYLANAPGAPFNANEYIRKDSIPCWGCTLPQ
jgi:hypothetical protein